MSQTLFLLFLLLGICQVNSVATGGTWKMLQKSIGISAMHMQLMNTDQVVIYDRTDFGRSNISLGHHRCRHDEQDIALKVDCTAHSVRYDVLTNRTLPLMVQTDTWCSSGSLMPDGSLFQTGGWRDGEHAVRIYRPCRTCDWEEIPHALVQHRWYATNHVLPDGRQIIIGGRREYNYEFYPKRPGADSFYHLNFLAETNNPNIENNLYPFVLLAPDGNLFIFANNRAILYDYKKREMVRSYPQLPDGNPRNYPSTGSAVLLPLKNLASGVVEAEVLVCGGAPKGSFALSSAKKHRIFVKALDTCARIKITEPSPHWDIETMPLRRVMGDMIILPNGHVLIINGAGNGTAGWGFARNPVLNPVIYKPYNKLGSRFEIQNPSTIPRMYHSTAILVRDGRVLVGGSNPHEKYRFSRVLFPTELSLEAFSPPYLGKEFVNIRPIIISPDPQVKLKYGQVVPVTFNIIRKVVNVNMFRVTMIAPPFNTHSFSMNQRLLVLDTRNVTRIGKLYEIRVNMPVSGNLAPAGYYMLFVVYQDIPSKGKWIHLE